jgi:O-antigen ligase
MVPLKKLISVLFSVLLFFVPLVLWPGTSEVFEFNKMVLTYGLTALIVGAWVVRSVYERKIIFRRTILDIPLLVFIGSQLISTILSIDPLTSFLGYYSRFNGGLLSTICYSLLYWAFVSNLDEKSALNSLRVTLISAGIVSFYGVLEHFGIDKNLWVQDVQSRVFSTLGQPNWLAAWLVALIPITWALLLKEKVKTIQFWVYLSVSILFFWTLLFTKSRSGILGFGVASAIFWGGLAWLNQKNIRKTLSHFLLIGVPIVIISLISGTQYTPNLYSLIDGSTRKPVAQPQGPALETGGTESGSIRKIVWKGATQVWSHYSIFGAGVETFAYSYYKYRPAEHNLVSEWDFIYNKAHNEFLNMAANSGTVGLLSYLFLLGATIYMMVKNKSENKSLNFALLAGYVSLSATNFFGFSVVPTQLQLFLFPAFAFALTKNDEGEMKKEKVGSTQKTIAGITIFVIGYLLLIIGRYWYADTLYSKGKAYNGIQKPDIALPYLTRAISLTPSQARFHSELAGSYTSYALAYHQQKDDKKSKELMDLAVSESKKSIELSPADVNLRRLIFGVYIRLSTIDPNYLISARDTLTDAVNYAPTDAKLYYNLGLVYARTGSQDLALTTLKKTVDLKANYKEARLAYAILLIENKQNSEAKSQLKYILENLDPNDSLTKQTLDGIE